MTKKEVWAPAPGYEHDYEISNRGRVKSHRRGREKYLRPIMERWNGYYCVSLFNTEGRMRKVKVHRLVALAFVDNPCGYACINHIDEDKTNNAADNLEWCTQAYNTAYGTARERARATLLRNMQDGKK